MSLREECTRYTGHHSLVPVAHGSSTGTRVGGTRAGALGGGAVDELLVGLREEDKAKPQKPTDIKRLVV